MISSIFHTGVYQPLYNALIWLVESMPMYDMGLAIILLTVLVRVILYPLSKKAIESQKKIKEIAPEVEKIKEKHKDDKKAQSEAIFALYKEREVKLSAGFILILIQLPILLALYWIFASSGLPTVDTTLLYSFIQPPAAIHMNFLGFIDLAERSLVLALFVIVTQMIYTRLAMGPRTLKVNPVKASFAEDMAASFDLQARYVLPLMFGAFAYYVAAAAPLFWITGNIAMIAQEYWSGRRF